MTITREQELLYEEDDDKHFKLTKSQINTVVQGGEEIERTENTEVNEGPDGNASHQLYLGKFTG